MKTFFNNLKVLIKCYSFFFLRGFANKPVTDLKIVAVIQTAKLGDMVCTTPVFRGIKNKHPKTSVTVIGNKINKEILAGNRDVDDYFVWEENVNHLKFFLENLNPDCVYITAPNSFALAGAYLAGVKLVISPIVGGGFCPTQTKLYKLLSVFVKRVPHQMGKYAPREYLRLLEPTGIYTEDTQKYLVFSKEAEEKVKRFLKDNSVDQTDLLIGIAPAAGNKIKQWPSGRFGEVADYLIEKHNARILLIGGPQDFSEEKEMLAAMKHKEKIISSVGKFSIDELKAIMSKLKLFIAVDTGPIYIAEAFNVTTVDIIGPIDENEQPPRGHNHFRVISPMRLKALMHVMNARIYDEREAKESVLSIQVNAVIIKVEEGLGFKRHK